MSSMTRPRDLEYEDLEAGHLEDDELDHECAIRRSSGVVGGPAKLSEKVSTLSTHTSAVPPP